MKKIISLLLICVMALSMVACGNANDGNKTSDEMKVAMITDSGDIIDQSFNQTTYEACKKWCESNGVEFTYYKPESDADVSRSATYCAFGYGFTGFTKFLSKSGETIILLGFIINLPDFLLDSFFSLLGRREFSVKKSTISGAGHA